MNRKSVLTIGSDGMARRLGRTGHFRAGQVHRESAGRARVL